MSKNSRYIKVEERKKVDSSSGLKCAWCGVNLMERHHIKHYAKGGSNNAENLILLCPNCHTLVHKGIIIENELLERKKELSGFINRSAGYLPIEKKKGVKIGSNTFVDTPKIIQHNDENLIIIDSCDNEMIVSLRLYSEDQKLLCWMHENKWWVENDDVFDFILSKRKFHVISNEQEIYLEIEIEDEYVAIRGRIFIDGYRLEFNENSINYLNPNIKSKIMMMKNCIMSNCGTAISLKT